MKFAQADPISWASSSRTSGGPASWAQNRHATHLADSPLFRIDVSRLSSMHRARLAHERARVFGHAFKLTAHDIHEMTPKFWAAHADAAMTLDGAAATLYTIQTNLVVGTLLKYMHSDLPNSSAAERDDLQKLVDGLVVFDLIGQFCLTELGHGLDSENLETTATMLPNGEFELNTPNANAAKYMPPTVPAGRPCVAIIFARMIMSGRDHGIRPFIVPLNDGHKMYAGIVARLLPYREGTDPVNHSLTSFHHVRLPRSALLGGFGCVSGRQMEIPTNRERHEQFLDAIWRVAVGTLSLSLVTPSCLEIACAVGMMYSMRRVVTARGNGSGKEPSSENGSIAATLVPIYTFRTQQIPLLVGIAQAYVLRAFHRWAAAMFSDVQLDRRIRHGIATCSKAVSVQHCQATMIAISERCGAQGLFFVNQMTKFHSSVRGIAIAEGDILGISIRLATELLLGRYTLPEPTNPDSLLARHEQGLIEEARSALFSAIASSSSGSDDNSHRNEAINKVILPRCQPLVEAIGHRMAYDAALAAGGEAVPRCLVDLYEVHVMGLDAAWYCTSSTMPGLTRRVMDDMETRALDAVLPHLPKLVESAGVAPFVTAPIASQEKWDAFVRRLPVFDSEGPWSVVGKDEVFTGARL